MHMMHSTSNSVKLLVNGEVCMHLAWNTCVHVHEYARMHTLINTGDLQRADARMHTLINTGDLQRADARANPVG